MTTIEASERVLTAPESDEEREERLQAIAELEDNMRALEEFLATNPDSHGRVTRTLGRFADKLMELNSGDVASPVSDKLF